MDVLYYGAHLGSVGAHIRAAVSSFQLNQAALSVITAQRYPS